MVMADRHYDDMKNGRRSRGGSPNDYSDDSSDELEHGEGRMRVGSDYQVKIPPFNPDYKPDKMNDAILVWAPCPLELPPIKVDEYVHIAKEKHGYNTEQALGMLFWHKHNVEKALADLPNFTPFPDEWTVEDKVLFEQAFSFHGKSFHRIRQMLPDKSIASLVKYYYSWKKTRSRTSLMDRQAKKLQSSRDIDSDEESDNSGSKKSDNEENSKENGKEEKGCSNCGVNLPQLHSTPKGSLCNSCYQYWRRTGVMRVVGHKRHEHGQHRHNPMKHKRKPPRGMYIQQEDLQKLVTGPVGQAEALIKSLDSELVSLKRLVQNNKQMLGLQKHKVGPGIDTLRPPESPPKINSRWTNEELLLALQGVRKYGRNFNAIAEVIGNKTEAHVRSFFINFRRRYNLDDVLAEYEAEHGVQSIKEEDDDKEVEKMDVDAKELEILSTSSGSSPGLPSTTSTPPPLLKQPQGVTPNQKSQPRLLPPQQQRTILQQPPPLIKPTNTTNTKASANA